MDKNIKTQEEHHLNNTLERVKQAQRELNESIQVMGTKNIDRLQELRENPETGIDFFLLLEQLHEKNQAFNFKDKYKILDEYSYLLKEPYFARIDLQGKGEEKTEQIYIGKFGFTDEKPVVTDWRSKIASVYYRYRYPQKNVKYSTPLGEQTRDLLLKRTFEIDEGELIKYYNNDIQLDEEQIIVDKIEQRTGGVLEDIVETIQESQLDIIEADPRQVCIVQGCVGSGKSTVAIHKLSHIFFNFPKLIRANRAVLVAKNQILVGYLSTLFPKLGIFDINYKTLKDLIIQAVFREEMHIKTDLHVGEDTSSYDIEKIKEVRAQIAKVHAKVEAQINDLFDDEIYESFKSFKYNINSTPYKNVLEIISDLEEELDMQKGLLKEIPNSPRAWLYKENVAILRKLLARLRKIRDRTKVAALRDMCKKLGINPTKTLNYMETIVYLFLYGEIVGFTKVPEYDYCVIDEGQDFSAIEYIVLNNFVLRGRLAVFGDLNQAIEGDGIKKWEEIPEVIKEAREASVFELNVNYRSTKQIIDLANSVLEPYTDEFLPKSINRHGPKPQIVNTKDKKELLATFKQKIDKDLENLDKSIGIICFNPDTYYDIEQMLDEKNLGSDTYVKLDATKQITYLPKAVYLSKFEDCKGLEFSKVYVLDLDLEKVNTSLFAKRAFVAITRAMNEVCILN